MNKHTQGPWRESWVRPDKRRGHTFVPRCCILADTPTGAIRLADIPDPITPEYEANAHLIAAAPDLLKVALMVAAWPHADGENHLVDDARSAVAKARGEEK